MEDISTGPHAWSHLALTIATEPTTFDQMKRGPCVDVTSQRK